MKSVAPTSPAAQAAALAGASLVLGLLFDWLFFGNIPGVSFGLYVAAILGGLFALASYLKRPLPKTALWLLLPIGFFAAMVAVRASEMLAVLNIFATLLLLLLVARVALRDELRAFNLLDYARIPFLPFKFIAPLFRTLGDFFTPRSGATNRALTGQIIRGVLLALPVLILLVTLLASADLVFQRYVTAAFSLNFDSETVGRIVLVSLVTLIFTGAYSYIFRARTEAPAASSPVPASSAIGKVEMSILLGSVNTLFFLFILVQLAYLFGGTSNRSSQGFTYAEYARKGFFELLAVALVTFGMLWGADKYAAKSARGHSRKFKILSGILIAEVIMIMVSAFRRLYLYEQAFGFTELRLYSHVFVIFLAVIFVLLLIKILRNQLENHFALPAFIAAILFLVGMNLLNPDAFIARQNLDRFQQTGKLDASYIGSLSDDAHQEKLKTIDVASGAEKDKLIDSLDRRTMPLDWQSWNLSRSQAGR